ncbi:transcription intermediary factor 1-beta-like [Astyanax mexicanus]|uniref:Transcription intermediary factor 1-beta-like n=1 Tax=Astyanax mexicanus TaxID=7994 RepID=A0A8B9K8F5_ASTMX|nr:transcription intermediary factor 1-beta-like [Astyanax mexicanus]
MERMSPLQMKLPQPEKSFVSCASCGLTLCSGTNPKLLPCLHSLCKGCYSFTDDIKECPICQEKCELQDIISNLLFAALPTNPKDADKCQRCEDPSVTGWCIECKHSFCTGCVVTHKRVKQTQKHYVHTITPECPRPVFCPIHKKELIYSYCLTCDKLICKLCQPLHPKHLLQFAREAVGKQRKQIQRMVHKAQQQRMTVQQNLKDLDGRLSDLEQLQAQVRMEVKETVVRLCNVMVKKAAKLNKEIKDVCGKEKEKLAERRSLLQKMKEKLDHVLNFTDKTLASQQHTVLLSCKKQIHHQLQGMLDQVISPISTVLDLSFHTNENHVKKVLKIFGHVVAKEVPFVSSSTGNVPNPSSPLFTPNDSLSAPTAAFQIPTNPTAARNPSPSSVILPQQSPPSPKQHPVLSHLLLKKNSNVPNHDSFSSSQNNKYSNYPGLKRAWSYHPYYPKDSLQPVKCSVKTVSPLNRRKERVPSCKASPPRRASSFFCTSAPVTSASVQHTVSAPFHTGRSSAQASRRQNSKGHQSNLDLMRRPKQQATNLSSTFCRYEPSKKFRSDLQSNKTMKNNPVSATVAAVGSCSAESQAPTPEIASISRKVKGYHCNQSEAGSKGSEKRTQPCILELEDDSHEDTIMNNSVKMNELALESKQTATQTNPPFIEKTEPTEESLAVTNVRDSHSIPLKEKDDKDERTFAKIRDDQGNIAVMEAPGRNWLPDVLVTRLPLPDFSPPSTNPALCILWEEDHKSFQFCAIKEDDQCPALTPFTPNASLSLLDNNLRCAACRIKGNLFQCYVCKKAFHRECHLPPISGNSGEQWRCTLCSDLSHSEDLDPSGCSPYLNAINQKKCEYLLLYLSCKKQGSVLYRAVTEDVQLSSQASYYVDMTLIRGRLLRKLTPYYVTRGQFISDVWLLLHTLLNSSTEPQSVMRLQNSFSKELMRVFGWSLHPSLLKNPFTGQ